MLFKRVRLSRGKGLLIVKGSTFTVHERGGRFSTGFLSARELDLFHDIRFRELPGDLVVASLEGPPNPPFNEGPRLMFVIERGRIACQISFSSFEWKTLLKQEEYFKELKRRLGLKGYAAGLDRYEGSLSLYLEFSPPPNQYIGRFVSEIRETVSEVNFWANSEEERLEGEAARLINQLTRFNGGELAKALGLGGVTRWLIAALTNEQIAYLVLNSAPLEIPREIAQEILRRRQLDAESVTSPLSRLGLVRGGAEPTVSKVGRRIAEMLARALRLEL